MTGWVAFALIAVTTAALLALLRLPRSLWPLGGAALLLGAAGYAWQGDPALPASAPAAAAPQPLSDAYIKARNELFGQFGGESMYFGVSDAALRVGDTDTAARILTGGVDYKPDNAAMWSELGTVIALHDRTVSPAAAIVFRRAIALAPDHPGPPFFFALAYIRAGQAEAALPLLRRAGALATKGSAAHDAMAALLQETVAGARFTPRP